MRGRFSNIKYVTVKREALKEALYRNDWTFWSAERAIGASENYLLKKKAVDGWILLTAYDAKRLTKVCGVNPEIFREE